MTMSQVIAGRIQELDAELTRLTDQEHGWAVTTYRVVLGLRTIALIASAGAGLAGIGFRLDARVTGCIALIPAAVAAIVSTFKLEAKANWHYRKHSELDALRSRLRFQLPETPSADNVAAIAAAESKLIQRMSEEWRSKFTLTWDHAHARGAVD